MDNTTVPIAVQVILLSIAVPLNAGILVVSLRRDLIQDNSKYFIANLAVLDIAVTLWLIRFLWTFAIAPDNLLFLEVIYRCWLIYALLATIMGLMPLTLYAHIAAHWPQHDGHLFSKFKCICYCFFVNLIPIVSYILIAHTCYTSFLCNMNATTYWLLSIALFILTLSSYLSYKRVCAKLLLVTKAGEKYVLRDRNSYSQSSDYSSECIIIEPKLSLYLETTVAPTQEDMFKEQVAQLYSATNDNRWGDSNLASHSLATAPQLPVQSQDELARLEGAQKIALVAILQIIKPLIIFLPRIVNFIVNTVIVPLVAADSDFIGKSRFQFYSDFLTSELSATIFCAQPFFDAAITLCLVQQYQKKTALIIKRWAKVVPQKTTVEDHKFLYDF